MQVNYSRATGDLSLTTRIAPPIDPITLEDVDDGLVRISGRLTITRAAQVEQQLALLAERNAPLALDLSGVERIDTVGAWLLHRLVRDHPEIRLKNASADTQSLLGEVAANDHPIEMADDTRPYVIRELDRFGKYIIEVADTFGSALGFFGLVLATGAKMVWHRRGVRWGTITVQMEQTAVSALGIIGLMSFLVGIVITQQGWIQLRQFGADAFIINLIGRAGVRELGIILAAIMVAGRSASAFAAQIGSMKLNEEIDALRTLGFDPIEILVIPRVIALMLMMPLLAFYSSIMSIVGGGLFSWVALDMSPASFIQRLHDVIPIEDLIVGLSKAMPIAAVIAIIGCHQGFQVTSNAESVGRRTTTAVVQSIFLAIVLDAFFAVFWSTLGF